MKIWRVNLVVAGMAWLTASVLAGQTPAAQQGKASPPAAPKFQTAGEFFKAVNTSTLKGLSVDDFIGAMGVMNADLGFDCADCHIGAGSTDVNWEFDTARKKTARKMVEMVAAINKTNFAGTQTVTCFTCHHGRNTPSTTIALDALYGPPNEEKADIVKPAQGVPSATAILDKYIAALGGAQKLAGLTSYIATGNSLGYEGLGGGGKATIYGKAPNQRTTLIQFPEAPERGNSARVFNGTTGWIQTPRALLKDYELIGSELDGARLDAQLAFPGQIKTILTNWRVGVPDSIGDQDVYVVQGSGPRGLLATFYFDQKSGLLVRLVRYSTSPIGRVPTQVDYSDYRDVGGIKFPFKHTFSWLDGKDAFQLTDIKTNVAIDASKFARPAAK